MIEPAISSPDKINRNTFPPFTTVQNKRVTLRTLKKDDVDLLIDLFHKLSPESKRLRFHANVESVDREVVRQEAERLADIDPAQQVALVAVDDTSAGEEAIAVARFTRLATDETAAELAVVVRDDFQGQGLGRHLLETLSEVARRQEIDRFVLLTTTENTAMLKLAKAVWGKVEIDTIDGEQEIWATIESRSPR